MRININTTLGRDPDFIIPGEDLHLGLVYQREDNGKFYLVGQQAEQTKVLIDLESGTVHPFYLAEFSNWRRMYATVEVQAQ